MNNIKLKRTALVATLLFLIAIYVHAESVKKNHKKQASKAVQEASKSSDRPWEAWDRYREQMLTISRQLGVTCTYCHDSRNYRSAAKKTHKIAKNHMEMVDMINEKFKNSFSQKVDCYMCHKGVAKPEFIEKKSKF